MRLPSVLSDIISKILRGKASKEETQQFNFWYDKGIGSEWHIQDHKNRSKEQVAAELLQKIRKATHDRISPSPSRKAFGSWKVAASLTLLVGMGFLVMKFLEPGPVQPVETRFLTFENAKGMIKKVRLPDGSMVSLFHDSKIQAAENFSENRLIRLSGEAFFEVERDTLHPFRVQSGSLTTEVLGTSFLVKNPGGNQTETVAVKTGLVKVSDASDSVFMLTPNLRLDYSMNNGAVSSLSGDDPIFSWTRDILAFDKTGMSEMVTTLENWYGVTISHNLTLHNTCEISGTYQKQSLEHLLQLIQYSIPVTYQIHGKNVTLNFKNCP